MRIYYSIITYLVCMCIWRYRTFAKEVLIDTKTFATSTELFPNPERGWIVHRYSHNMWGLDTVRTGDGNVSLLLIQVDIGTYRNSAHIGQSKLDEVRTALNTCRTLGLKAVLRSAYAWNEVLGPDPIDLQTIINHISDMKPIYHEYEDTIIAVEMGMFGPWGEMHSSKHSTINTQLYYPIKTDALRVAHKAYMSALPNTCYVLLRRPYYIREIFNSQVPVGVEDAYGKTEKGRTGYHNDGYLSDETDLGTYNHNWTREQELNYINAMTRYAIFGGETVWSSNYVYSSVNNALKESERAHMTYLNRDYDTSMYNTWGTLAKNEFTRRLGYRFELISFSYSKQVAPGAVLSFTLKLKNTGFASMYRSRPVFLILDNQKLNANQIKYQTTLSVDPRTWTPESGIVTIQRRISIPLNIATGSWQLLLALPDASQRLSYDPRYAVRFGNVGVWDSTRGANILTKELNITIGAPAESNQYVAFQEIVDQSSTLLISQINVIKSAQSLTLTAAYATQYLYHQVFIDVDNDATTGYTIKGIGADLLIENEHYYYHQGNAGSNWDWKYYGEISSLSTIGLTYSWRLATNSLREPILPTSRIIFAASDGVTSVYSAVISTTVV